MVAVTRQASPVRQSSSSAAPAARWIRAQSCPWGSGRAPQRSRSAARRSASSAVRPGGSRGAARVSEQGQDEQRGNKEPARHGQQDHGACAPFCRLQRRVPASGSSRWSGLGSLGLSGVLIVDSPGQATSATTRLGQARVSASIATADSLPVWLLGGGRATLRRRLRTGPCPSLTVGKSWLASVVRVSLGTPRAWPWRRVAMQITLSEVDVQLASPVSGQPAVW